YTTLFRSQLTETVIIFRRLRVKSSLPLMMKTLNMRKTAMSLTQIIMKSNQSRFQTKRKNDFFVLHKKSIPSGMLPFTFYKLLILYLLLLQGCVHGQLSFSGSSHLHHTQFRVDSNAYLVKVF